MDHTYLPDGRIAHTMWTAHPCLDTARLLDIVDTLAALLARVLQPAGENFSDSPLLHASEIQELLAAYSARAKRLAVGDRRLDFLDRAAALDEVTSRLARLMTQAQLPPSQRRLCASEVGETVSSMWEMLYAAWCGHPDRRIAEREAFARSVSDELDALIEDIGEDSDKSVFSKSRALGFQMQRIRDVALAAAVTLDRCKNPATLPARS